MKLRTTILCLLLAALLAACGPAEQPATQPETTAALSTTARPAATAPAAVTTQVTTAPPETAPPPPPLPGYTPALRAARAEDEQASRHEVIFVNSIEQWYSANKEDFFTLELTCQAAVTDLLVMDLLALYESGDELSYEAWLYAHAAYGILHYIPSLAPGQAIRLTDAWASEADMPLDRVMGITYTNSAGQGETVLVFWDAEAGFVCQPVAAEKAREGFDAENNGLRYWVYPEAVAAARDTDFGPYIPYGFELHYAVQGDVDGDGLEDALLILTAAGAVTWGGDMTQLPLFILLGQPGGGYEVAQRLSHVTYTAARYHATAVAGQGYIDIVSEWSSGAAYSYIEVARFAYNAVAHDWLLDGYSMRHVLDYERAPALELVAPLPGPAGMSLGAFEGMRWPAAPEDEGFFADTADLSVVWHRTLDGQSWLQHYFIGIRPSPDGRHYDGYVFSRYEDSTDLEATFRGELPAGGLAIEVDTEGFSFSVGEDVWQYNKDIDEFLLGGPYTWFDE